MKNTLLTGLLLASGLGCHGTTSIGGTDASNCNVTLPKMGFYGPNILLPGSVSFIDRTNYELGVQHDAAATVIVNMTLLSAGGLWQIGNLDWRATTFYGRTGETQTFEAPQVTGEFEESMYFQGTGDAKVDVFECGAATPTVSKIISWSPPDGGVPLGDGGAPYDASMGDDAQVLPLDGGIVTGPVGGE
jgi:hypothetical protein